MVVLEKGQFERLAGLIAERTAELLLTRVWITDGRGVVIAGNEPGAGGTSFDAVDRRSNVHYLRVPLRQGLESGEVIIAEPGTGESVSPRLAQVLVELIIDQASLIDRLPNKHELKAKFVHDLLHDTVRDENALCREAQVLGMDLTCPRAVMLIDAAEYISGGIHGDRFDPSDARIRRRAQLLIGRIVDFFELPNDTICTYIGEGEVVVLKAVNRITWVDQDDVMERADQSWINLNALKKASVALLFRLRSDTRTAISLGIGRYHRGLHGLSRSCQDARAALSLGQWFHGHNQVHCLDSLGIAAFDIDLTRSWFVGDILDDVEAGNRAGCRTVLVDLGTESLPDPEIRRPDFVARDTPHALDIIQVVEGVGSMADLTYRPTQWVNAANQPLVAAGE